MLLLPWSLFVLCSSTVAAHGAGGPGILGGPEALRALAPRFPSRINPHSDFKDVFQREDEIFPGELLTARAEKTQKMNCGAVNGSCPAGYWYVLHHSFTTMKDANTSLAVLLEVGGK